MYQLKHIDQFGVPLQLKIMNNDKTKKTFIGGIITLTIFSLSLGYLISNMICWLEGGLPPIITTNLQMAESINYTFQKNSIQLGILNQTDNDIDPFDQNNNILTPILFEFEGNQVLNTYSIFTDQQTIVKHVYGSKTILTTSNVDLQYNSASDYLRSFVIVLKRCEKEFLNESQKCASEEMMSQYFLDNKQQSILQLSVMLEQFDSLTMQKISIPQTYYLAFTPQLPQYTQLSFQATNVQVNKGVIFDSITKSSYLSGMQVITQAVGSNFYNKMIGDGAIYSFVFTFSRISSDMAVTYPNLGVVLASVGSIVQLLLLLQYIALGYNEFKLEEQLLHEIITYIKPSIRDYKVKFNIIGQIASVKSIKGEDQDIKSFREIYAKLKSEASQWLSILHILKEIIQCKEDKGFVEEKRSAQYETNQLLDIPEDEKVIVGQMNNLVRYKSHK
ncbi:hypothetical protein pb186bvf_012124 [Paramecium bursaria]